MRLLRPLRGLAMTKEKYLAMTKKKGLAMTKKKGLAMTKKKHLAMTEGRFSTGSIDMVTMFARTALIALTLLFTFHLSPFTSCVHALAERAPKIRIMTEDVSLGEVAKGETFDYKIEVKNVGTGDLVIENVYSSCGCIEVIDGQWSDSEQQGSESVHVKPDSSIYISVKVDTNKVFGDFMKHVFVVSNDPENKEAAWTVRGIVFDALSRVGYVEGISSLNINRADNIVPTADTGIEEARILMVFYAPGCRDCREILEAFLPELKKKYKTKIVTVEYNIENPEAFAFLLELQDRYDERPNGIFFNPKPPIVVVENRILYGAGDIKKNLEEIIR